MGEEEQEGLLDEDQASLDPNQDNSKVKIQVESEAEPEVNPEVFRDVESMIYRGFLILPAEINGVRFVFKSLNHHEFTQVQLIQGGGQDFSDLELFYNLMASYGVLMVGGVNILPDRDKYLSELVKTFGSLPASSRSKVVWNLAEINRRASCAVALTEAYVYEGVSRFRWAQVKGLDLMSPSCTGLRGTEDLGLNYSQLVWRALNYYEDMKEQALREWDNAKFLGSCSVGGKEIQKISKQDKDRRDKEKAQRLQRRDMLIRQSILGTEEKEPTSEEEALLRKMRPATMQDLASQLEKDLRGDKDWHDQVIAAETAKLEKIQKDIREREQSVYELASTREEAPTPNYNSLKVGFSLEEAQARLMVSKREAAENLSKMRDPEEAEKRERLLAKYGSEDGSYQDAIVAPQNMPQTDRDTSAAVPIISPRPRQAPFKR